MNRERRRAVSERMAPDAGSSSGISSIRPRRGRPASLSDEERRRRILDALDEIFAQSGIDGISMSAVARHAGMSKRTLYTIFADRTALFVAYLDRMKAGHVCPLDPADLAAPLESRLRRLLGPVPVGTGLQLPLCILRTIVAEVPDRPEVGAELLDSVCVRTGALIRAELDRAVTEGEIAAADTWALAALLLDMVRPPPFEALLCAERLPTDAALRQRFELAIRVFLDGVRPR